MSTPYTPQQVEAAKRKKRILQVRKSFVEWCRHCGFEPALHHRLIAEKLEAVVRGDIKRLAFFLPPGSAKSTYASVLFPPWFLSQGAQKSILTASHSASLATKFGRLCRNLVDEHETTLGFSLAKDSQAVDDWGTSNKSVYFCAGVGGRIAGHRADLGIIDDPIGSVEDADSQNIRDSVWDWWEWNFMPRLKPNAAVVVISTRWHEDDLMGRLLQQQPGRWEVLSIPMEAIDNDPLGRAVGERLWPDYFTDEMVNDAKANPRKWNGAYQQNPSPDQGDYFKKEWILGYEPQDLPTALTIYCASDHACSTKENRKADSNILVPFGVDSKGNIWILPDVWWEVANTGTTVREMLKMMQRRNPVVWVAETEHIVKSIGPFLKQAMRDVKHYTTRIQEIPSRKDKSAKARSIQGKLEFNQVFFPKFAKWWPKAENEMLTFPVGIHDEFPDVLGVIGRFLESVQAASEPKDEPEIREYTYGWLKKQWRRQTMEEEVARDN